MKKGLGLVTIGSLVVLGFSLLAFAESMTAGFKDYLIPQKMSTTFYEKKVTIFLTTKRAVPAKVDDKAGWMVGLDTDMNKETGGKWPQIGADYILSVINQNGKWETTLKNVKTGASHAINGEVMVDKDMVDFSIPFNELENKTDFNWQIAVVSGDNRKALPDVLTASKKNQKSNESYDDAMKKMKM